MKPPPRHPPFRFLLLALASVTGVLVPAAGADEPVPVPLVAGGVDLTDIDFESSAPVALDGQWLWFPGAMLGGAPPQGPGTTLELPVSLPPGRSRGVGTLVATVQLPSAPRLYGLKLPYMASANRVFLNGEAIGGSGSVGDPYRAQYRPVIVFFTAGGSTLLEIEVANHHHRRMRLNRVYLGSEAQIRQFTHRRMLRDAILSGSLLFLAAYHLLVFFLNRRDRAFAFFAAVAALTALRLGIIRERLLVMFWPDIPPELMMKLGYAPAFLLPPLIVMYLDALSPYNTLERTGRLARGLAIALLALVAFMPIAVYDWVLEYGLIALLALAAYVLVLVARGNVFPSPHGTVVIVVGSLMVLAAGLNDYLREIGWIQTPELVSVGIVVFLLLQAYFLAWRFRSAYDDIRGLASTVQTLNQTLEDRIDERTRALADANRRLEQVSRTDGLTGIANRRYLDEALGREWHRAIRAAQSVAVILADIDHFKAYNDFHGHLSGDDCLRRIAAVLAGGARRRTDVVARYGGEEFMLLLPDTDVDTATGIAETLRREIETLAIPHGASTVAEVVTTSFGVAAGVPDRGDSAPDLVRRADVALYRAKSEGRNRVIAAPAPAPPARDASPGSSG